MAISRFKNALALACFFYLQAMPGIAQAWFTDDLGIREPEGLVTREQWGSKPQSLPADWRQVPKTIVIHHAGVPWKTEDDPADKVRRLQIWGQRDKNWPDLPYHYLISPDGQVFQGRDWHYQPESNTDYELRGVLNVQLFGDFQVQEPSSRQLEALGSLLKTLAQEHKIGTDRALGHRDLAPGQTSCPGDNFYPHWQGLLQELEALKP